MVSMLFWDADAKDSAQAVRVEKSFGAIARSAADR